MSILNSFLPIIESGQCKFTCDVFISFVILPANSLCFDVRELFIQLLTSQLSAIPVNNSKWVIYWTHMGCFMGPMKESYIRPIKICPRFINGSYMG